MVETTSAHGSGASFLTLALAFLTLAPSFLTPAASFLTLRSGAPGPQRARRALGRRRRGARAGPLVRMWTGRGDPSAARAPGAARAAADDGYAERWGRGGQVAARLSRIDWATLLRRTYDVDVLACPACGGRLRFVAVVTDATAVREALSAAGLDAAAPPVARARSPDDEEVSVPDAACDPPVRDTYADPPAPLDSLTETPA